MYDLNVSGTTQPPRRSSDHTVEHKGEFIPSTNTNNNTNNNNNTISTTTIPIIRRTSTAKRYSLYDRQNPVHGNNSRSEEEEEEEVEVEEDALKQKTRRPSDSASFNAINNNNNNNNNNVSHTLKHMRRPSTQEQEKEKQETKEEESQYNSEEMPMGLQDLSRNGVSGPHTPRLSISSPVVVHMGALTGPVVHDIIMQTRMNFHNPPKLTLQPHQTQQSQLHQSQQTQLQQTQQLNQPRPFLTPPAKSNYLFNKRYESSAVFSMSPGGATSLSTSIRQGSVGSFHSTPHTPQTSWAKLREKTVRHVDKMDKLDKVDKVGTTTPVLSLPRDHHADFSNGDVSPMSAFPISLLNYRSPLTNKQTMGNETPTSTEFVFQQQQSSSSSLQQLQQPKEKEESVELSPFALTKKPLSSKTDEASGNSRTQQQQKQQKQQQQQTLLQVSISSTNKSSISSTRYSGMNSTSSYCNGRPANLSTSISVSLPAISFPNGTCVPLQAIRNGKNSGLNHIEKSPRTTKGRMRMGSGFSETNSGMQISCSSQGGMESVRSMPRQPQPQERKNRSVQELLVQEIVTQLRPK